MRKGILLYRSKYGATKKYVDWLADATGFECIETSKASPSDLERCDVVVLCGGVYASGIAGLSFFKKNLDKLKHKKAAIFCVGASPYEEDAFRQVCEHNLKGDLNKIPCFYGRGAWKEEAMTLRDRALCKLLHKAVAKKNPAECEPWEKALLEAAGKSCDWTDQTYLEPLLAYLKQ